MEKAKVNIAEEITLTIKKLSPEKMRIVADFVNAVKDESFKITKYSDEDMAKIEQDALEAKQGINVSGPFVGEEANEHLRRLIRKS